MKILFLFINGISACQNNEQIFPDYFIHSLILPAIRAWPNFSMSFC